MTIELHRITQGERGIKTFTWEFPTGLTSPASILGATITAVMRNTDTRAVTAVTGTLTGTAADEATWELSETDSGTAGSFAVVFRAVVAGVATYTLEAHLAIGDNPAVDTVPAGALVGVSADDAAWLAASEAGGPLGTAAYEDVVDLPFDAAGAAAVVQGNLTTHIGLTGTAVHGLGSASTLTAGATGAALVATATQDAARAVVGLAAVSRPSYRANHHLMTWTASNVVGSGVAANTANAFIQVSSGATANSTVSFRPNTDTLYIGGSAYTDWSKKNVLSAVLTFATDYNLGVSYVVFGKAAAGAYGIIASGDYVALETGGRGLVNFHLCKDGTVTTVPITGQSDARNKNLTIVAEAGTAALYIDGVVVAQSTAAPTGAKTGTTFLEANNGAAATSYAARWIIWSEVFI